MMTEVDKAVNIPPMPEHISLAVNSSLDEPTKPQMLMKMLGMLMYSFTVHRKNGLFVEESHVPINLINHQPTA